MRQDLAHDRSAPVTLFALASVALGHAVQVSNGNLHPEAVAFLSIALGCSAVAVLLPRSPLFNRWPEGLAVFVIGAGLCWQFQQLFTTAPGIYLQPGARGLMPFFSAMAVAAVIAGATLSAKPWLGRFLAVALVGVWLWLALWLLRTSPSPFIDVFVFQRDAAAALMAGHNPWSMTYPDIYGNSPFYGEGMSVNGRLTFGFPYPPLSLLLVLPGHILAGDYRVAQVVALAFSALGLAWLRPNRVGLAAAALLLFTPRMFFVLEQGWTEPIVVALLTVVVLSAARAPRLLPWMLGLLFAVKQYTVFMLPLAFLLLPRPLSWSTARPFLVRSLGLAAAVTLPFVLWDPLAFWHDVVALQFYQPFRVEALSYLAWWARDGSPHLPTALAFVAAGVGVALSLWRAPRTPAGFAGAVALTYACFFAFNKQAFCNYYFLVIGSLCVAVAAAAPEE